MRHVLVSRDKQGDNVNAPSQVVFSQRSEVRVLHPNGVYTRVGGDARASAACLFSGEYSRLGV